MTEQEKKEELARLEAAWERVRKREKRYKFLWDQAGKQRQEIEKAINEL